MAERVQVLGALRSLRFKKKLSAEKRQEMHFVVSNEEKEKWIEDFVKGETTVARKLVQVVETVIMQEHKDMSTAENAGATTSKPEQRLKRC